MINGVTLRDAVISGANNISANRQAVDELNVFPVPDGDTGTNMSMTINAAAREIKKSSSESIGEVSNAVASALLRGARGNSGVILSLLFRGFAKGFKGIDEADGKAVVEALNRGVASAYKAVMNPTEGTILTVARVGAEHAAEAVKTTNDAVEVFEAAYKGSLEALEQTPELLPALKKAGVVDSGGKGLTLIYEGMLSVFKSGVIMSSEEAVEEDTAPAQATTAVAEWEGEITFTYCTEFIVKRDASVDLDPAALRAYLETIGDCVVVVDDEEIIKVHVHTDNPGKALQRGLKYGMLTNMKIENMREQHDRAVAEAKQAAEVKEFTPAPKENKYGFVSVCAGDGLTALFTDLGADTVVSGGQTMNPSTDNILRAIESTPAETVFVLPNNKNIIMAAEQAIPLADRKVNVLHTRTIPMGISAMLSFDSDLDEETNLINMMNAADKVSTGLITFAARNSDYDGKKINEGEILAIDNGRIAFTDTDLVHAAAKLTKSLYKKKSSFVTLIYGSDVSDEAAASIQEAVSAKLPASAEITLINGGQPVYYLIISVE